MTQDMPTPPSRLMNDRRLLNREVPPDWERRRCNKMRERFTVMNKQPMAILSLTAPVQPSTRVGL